MTTYWHLAGAGYNDGDDLLSFAAQLDAGRVTAEDWRWEHALEDAQDAHFVSLFATAKDALAWLDYAAPDGCKIVRVEIPEDNGRFTVFMWRQDADVHPAVMERIPGAMCEVVDLAALEAASVDEG